MCQPPSPGYLRPKKVNNSFFKTSDPFSLFFTLATDSNEFNTRAAIGLKLTSEFSETTEQALTQDIPDYLTYTRLAELVKYTVTDT